MQPAEISLSGGRKQGRQKFIVICMVLLLICFTLLMIVPALFPYPALKEFLQQPYSTVVLDRHGRLIRTGALEDGLRREWSSLDEYPAGAVRIFIKAEDKRFYWHPGVDPLALLRSLYQNRQAGRTVSGASTITMQLARLIQARPRTMQSKMLEAWDALKLEARLSKKEILELYLNTIPFGSNTEGVPAMLRTLWSRPLEGLDESRAALLAVVPRRPALYNPALNPQAATEAAMELSERAGLDLDRKSLEQAAAEAAGNNQAAPFEAPHFTERLYTMYGENTAKVLRSTLDLDLQHYAEDRLMAELELLEENRISNGAILAFDNTNGAVRIYLGSASWFDDKNSGQIDGIQIRNQPGSCLKPFLYALALENGFLPSSVLPDLPTVFGSGEAYIPSNFNRRFNGPVRLRVALASSLNIPAVYTLERLGVSNFEDYLVRLGIESIRERAGSHGTGLALGNAELSLEELTRAFSVFPRGGSTAELCFLEGAATGAAAALKTAETAASPHSESETLMSPYTAWIISDILSDKASRFTGFGFSGAMDTDFNAMFKTGTANQFQHIWALGATDHFTVGVWMGNFSGETVIGSTGSSVPARIAAQLLQAMEQDRQVGQQEAEAKVKKLSVQNMVEIDICPLSGMAATPACSGTLKEYFPADRIPAACTWHQSLAGGRASIQYPAEYRAWLADRSRTEGVINTGTAYSIRIPRPGSLYYLDPSYPHDAQALWLESSGFEPGTLVLIDSVPAGALDSRGRFLIALEKGTHHIEIQDEFSNTAQSWFTVR